MTLNHYLIFVELEKCDSIGIFPLHLKFATFLHCDTYDTYLNLEDLTQT